VTLNDLDDLALLAPACAMRTLLNICDDYVKHFSIVFNAGKSACLLVTSNKFSSDVWRNLSFILVENLFTLLMN